MSLLEQVDPIFRPIHTCEWGVKFKNWQELGEKLTLIYFQSRIQLQAMRKAMQDYDTETTDC